MLNDKLNEYLDKFGENFPLFFFQGKEDGEIIGMIDDCLKSEKPIEVDDVDGEV